MTLAIIVLLLLLFGGRLFRALFWVAVALFFMGFLSGAHLLFMSPWRIFFGAPWQLVPGGVLNEQLPAGVPAWGLLMGKRGGGELPWSDDAMGMNVTLEQLAGYCAEVKVKHIVYPERGVIDVFLRGREGIYYVLLELLPERETLMLRTLHFLGVPESEPQRRIAVAQAVAHINTLVLLGAFGLHLPSGNVMFDIPIPLSDSGLSPAQLERSLIAIGWTLDTYLPKLQRLRWGDAPVEEVLGLPLRAPSDALAAALAEG